MLILIATNLLKQVIIHDLLFTKEGRKGEFSTKPNSVTHKPVCKYPQHHKVALEDLCLLVEQQTKSDHHSSKQYGSVYSRYEESDVGILQLDKQRTNLMTYKLFFCSTFLFSSIMSPSFITLNT